MNKNSVLICMVLIGLAAALLSFSHRFRAESRNRMVELVIDWSDAQALANTTSHPIDDVLQELKNAGATSVAVQEDTLDLLRANGILGYRREGASTVLTFTTGFPGQLERVEQVLAHKTRLNVMAAGPYVLRVQAPWPQFNGIPIGLDAEVVATIRRNHLRVAPRLLNYTGATPESIAWELKQTRTLCGNVKGMGPLIFAGAAVLGNRASIAATAEQLDTLDLDYGSVEFSKMLGDEELSKAAQDHTIRVHSIANEEMGTMDEPTAQERFVRAGRERNIRVCYIRLFVNGLKEMPGAAKADANSSAPKTPPDVIDANVAFIKHIVDGLTVARLTVGKAHPWRDDPKPGRALAALMALGIAGGGLLLLRLFTGISGRAFWMMLVACILLAVGLSLVTKGREVLALIAACTFPTLGLCWFKLPKTDDTTETITALPISYGTVIGQTLKTYSLMSLVTLAGIVFVAGLLAGRLYMLKVEQFLGVKLILVAPVVLTAIYYGLGLADLPRTAVWNERKARAASTIQHILSQPLLIGQLVTGLIALVALALFVARSGNDPGVGVSATELHMRALMDKYLLVRPRTKEFLLGHPALLFGLAAAYSGRFGKWTLPLLVAGAIGQSSMLDTFCHLHTPLFLSLLRALIGWVLGAIIGALVFVVAGRIARKSTGTSMENSNAPSSTLL